MTWTRRSLLKGITAGGSYLALAATGLLKPVMAFAAEWNKAAFDAKDMAGAMSGVGAASASDSADVVVKAPSIAENGAVVPIEVMSKVAGTTSIAVFVENNPFPLAGQFNFANGALPEVSLRLKFAKTSNVKVVALAGGKAYTAQTEVKVTAGGCGG